MIQPLAEVLAGLVFLSLGGHYIVTGAINVARLLRMSTAVAGLIVVAFGTSLPELAVSLDAAAGTGADIAYANVVGSNIFNLAVILAIVAMIKPIQVADATLQVQYPGMMIVMTAGVIVSFGGAVNRTEGAVLTVGLLAFVTATLYFARRGRAAALTRQYEQEVEEAGQIAGPRSRQWTIGLIMVAFGILGLWLGAEWMVSGAVTLAEIVGVSDRIIGLTVVAMGTSLPELAASIAASRHGDSKVILGNLLGSNIFNVLAILGITGMVHSVPVTARAVGFDNWFMMGLALAVFPIMATGKRQVGRGGGAILLGGFAVYFALILVLRG